jgi:hypothetical protein
MKRIMWTPIIQVPSALHNHLHFAGEELPIDHETLTTTNSFRSTMRRQSYHRLIVFDWTAGWFSKIQQSTKIHQARNVLC